VLVEVKGMNIDTLLQDDHEGQILTIEEQLRAIERDLTKRHFLSVMTTNTLFDQLRKVETDILQLLPEFPGAPDPFRRERLGLEQEARKIGQRIDEEQLKKWQDEEALHRERRALVREHREELQQYALVGSAYR
jgi:hypothetical protein